MDLKIMQEVQHVIEDLNEKIDASDDSISVLNSVDTFFDLPDLNVIWELVAGIRYYMYIVQLTDHRHFQVNYSTNHLTTS